MRQKTVLVIDDEEMIRKTVCASLARKGFAVHAANDGNDGILRAIELKPDIVICDSQMPGMRGKEVIAELKRNPATAHLPVIMISGSEIRETAGQADDFIAKPFLLEDLICSINNLIANARPAS